MANLWNKTVDINITLAKHLIENQRLLHVDHIQPLDEGWDNTAFLVNHEFIFRFPHRLFGVKCMENEIALLPKLKPYLSFHASIPVLSVSVKETRTCVSHFLISSEKSRLILSNKIFPN